MAATLALVFAAALMVKTFVSIMNVNPGFDPRGTLTFLVTPSSAKHPGAPGVAQYYAELDRSLRAVPGVTAVTTMSHVPFQLGSQTDWFMRDDVGDRGKENPTTGVTIAAQGFERAVRLTILEGRSFTTADDSGAPRVVMINEALAKQAFSGVDPVGKTIHWSKEQWRIIGVVADAHDKSLTEAPPKMLYAHYPQRSARTRWVIVRTNGAHGSDLIGPVRAALRSLDPTVPLSYMATLDDRIADSVAAHRFRAWLVGSLGLLACTLALLGIYAIVSQAVTRRTREIGIRIALGQDAASVQRGIVAGAIRVAAVGSAVGLGLSVAVGRSLSTFLYAVNGRDPLILGSATALLLLCCGLAAFVPARRASRVDPVVALRAE
jgi:predicted permease